MDCEDEGCPHFGTSHICIDKSEPIQLKRLVQVTAPHFTAGIIVSEKGICEEAAPILNWSVGFLYDDLARYFKKKQWEFKTITEF